MKSFQCSFEACGRTFNKQAYLTEHYNRHINNRPYSCTLCSKSYFKKNNLTVHMKIHSEKEFKCELCEMLFLTKDKLKRHKLTCNKEFSCSVCKRIYVRKGNLINHERKHKKRKRKLHFCEICKGAYRSKKTLDFHKKTQHDVLE